MSSNPKTLRGPAVPATPSVRSYSYSRKRWNAFEAWQEYVRKSAAAAGTTLPVRHDRDLRRAVVSG